MRALSSDGVSGEGRSRTLVFTATYNEADNIGDLIDRIFAELPSCAILVVDDNSPDGTGRLLQARGASDESLHVIVRPRKLGVGSAHKLGMKFALAHGFDRLITMDADFSHDPRYLPRMAELLDDHDFVIGSRYAPGGTCEYPVTRRWFSRGANFLARRLLDIPLMETTTSFRGFRRELLERFDVDSIEGDGYSYFLGCVYRATRLSRNVAEFPIAFVDRRAGATKISRDEIVKALARLGALSFRRAGSAVRRRSDVGLERVVPDGTMPCPVCGGVYQVEKYPASVDTHTSAKYSCTSLEHSSHGRIVRCLSCGLVFTNPQLPADEVTSLYTNVQDPVYLANVDARERTFTYNLEKIRSLLPSTGRLLDVGSYTGAFLKIARNAGYDVTGVEPSVWAARYASEELDIPTIQGTLEDVPPDFGRFDVVCSWDVLEHVSDPMGELQRINEVTELNGWFAFSTLNIDSWPPRVLGERWPWLMDMHLYYFNEKVVEEMLSQAGFALRYVGTYCHIITAPYLMRKLESLGVPGAGALSRRFGNSPLRRLYIPFRFGDIQLFVAEKVRELSTETIAPDAVAQPAAQPA